MQLPTTRQRTLFIPALTALTILFACILLLPSISAQRVTPFFDVQTQAINDTFYPGGSAVFNITIINKQEFDDKYFFFVPDIQWSPQTIPPYYFTSGVDVPAESNKTILFYLKSRAEAVPGTYYLELITDSQITNKELSKILSVVIEEPPEEPIDLSSEISMSIDMPTTLVGGQTYPIRISITNPSLATESNATLELSSSVIEEQTTLSIPSNSTQTFEFTLSVPESITTQSVPLIAELYTTSDILATAETTVQTEAMEREIEKEVAQDRGFLSKTTIITLINPNQGGREAEVRFDQSAPNLLTNYNYKPNLETDDGTVGWVLHVPGNDQRSIEVRTNYLPLVLIILLLAGGAVAYVMLSSPVSIKKKVITQECKSGSVCTLKIQLTVTNKTNKDFSQVSITDVLPYLGHHVREETIGSLPPDKVLRYNNETYLKWKLENLEAYEERVFAYRMNLKLSIIGSFFLKPALIKVGTKKIFSNKIVINNTPSQ